MGTLTQDFEQYLQDVHAKGYHGPKCELALNYINSSTSTYPVKTICMEK